MIRGADFSDAQDRAALERALAEGIRFAFVKLTQGNEYVNPQAQAQLGILRAHGLRLGVYHYLDLTAPPARQWEHFAAELERLPFFRELLVCLDYEQPGTTDAQAAAFVAAGRAHGYRVGLYSSAATHGYAPVGATYRWLAHWIPAGAKPATPPRGAAFWQWLSTGGQDWDLFVGSAPMLAAFWAAHAGRAPVYRVTVYGNPQARLGPFPTWRRAALAALAFVLRHPRRTGYRVDRIPA